jgi:hypothetical protein
VKTKITAKPFPKELLVEAPVDFNGSAIVYKSDADVKSELDGAGKLTIGVYRLVEIRTFEMVPKVKRVHKVKGE